MSREFKAHTTPPIPPIVDPPLPPSVDPRRPPIGDPAPEPDSGQPVPVPHDPPAPPARALQRTWFRPALVRVHRARAVH